MKFIEVTEPTQLVRIRFRSDFVCRKRNLSGNLDSSSVDLDNDLATGSVTMSQPEQLSVRVMLKAANLGDLFLFGLANCSVN